MFQIGMNGTDRYKMMKMAYGDACLARLKVFKWFGRFWEGCESVENEVSARCQRTNPTANNSKHVRTALKTDWLVSIRMLVDELKIVKETIRQT